jgi:uncharacterized protein
VSASGDVGQPSGDHRRAAAECIVIVMAKAPIAGYAKSRLASRLGAAGAAALAERLLVHAVQQAASAGFDTVELCAAPDPSHPAFQRLQAQHRLRVSRQGAGDLGDRMHRALRRALATHARAILIGTDAPGLDSGVLRRAADALTAADAADAVFVPAHDGGYALVGMRQPIRALFEGIDWSTDRVMRQTRERAAACGARLAELAPIADIDEPDDLVHLPPGWLT